MAGDFSLPLSLENVCEGKLNEEFIRMYPELVESLGEKNKASVGITIILQRVPDTLTMVQMSYRIKPTFPNVERSSICQIEKDCTLKTDAPSKKQTLLKLDGGKVNE